MPYKSARMVRAGKHVLLLNGKPHHVVKVELDGEIFVFHCTDIDGNQVSLRRSSGAKIEVR